MDDKTGDSVKDKLNFYTAIVIGLATFLGAFAAYYSGLWGGNCLTHYNEGSIAMTEASTVYLEALSDYNAYELNSLKDDLMYAEYMSAQKRNDQDDMEYFKSRMTPVFAAFLDEPDESMNEDSAYAIVEKRFEAYEDSIYTVYQEAEATADSLYNHSKEVFKLGQAENQYGDAFTLVTVIFTMALFFGGVSAISRKNNLKIIYFAIMLVVFAYATVKMFVLPFP